MARILRRIVFAGLIIAAGLAASRLLAAPPTNRAGLQGTISDLATDRPLAGRAFAPETRRPSPMRAASSVWPCPPAPTTCAPRRRATWA